MKNINEKSFSNLFKLEFYRLFKSKIYLYTIVFEIIAILLSWVSNPNDFFSKKDLIASSYFNLSLTLRYLSVAIIVSSTFSTDMKTGLFTTYIAKGVKRSKLLLAKIFSILSVIIISQFIGSVIFIIVVIIKSGLEISLLKIFIYNVINLMPLSIFILMIIFIDIVGMSSSITFIFTFSLIFFTTMLPYNIGKYILVNYNNVLLVFNYGDSGSIITMIIVIISYLVIFLFSDFYYIRKIDL